MTDKINVPTFTPTLRGFRAEEFMALSETLLAMPIEQDQARLDAAPFRLDAPEPQPEAPIPPLPPRWYPRPAPEVIEAARAWLAPPPRPAILEGRTPELERVLRPLLSGQPVQVRGEPGVGKSALLATVAVHERTRRRFRRIWWIDQPARLDQTLALALNQPHILVESDPIVRREWLAGHLDEHTLLLVDNALPDDPVLVHLAALTPHVLVAVETSPEILDPDEPLPEDPEGVVTLRALDDTAAIDALAQHAEIDDTRRIRSDLLRIAHTLGNHPYALALAGMLVRRDGLTLDILEQTLALETGSESNDEPDPDEDEASEDGEQPASLNRALDVSLAALPRDYFRLFEAFGAFSPEGAPFAGLHAVARIGSPLATRRGLIMLAEYGFVRRDHRNPDHYVMHPVAYARVAGGDRWDKRVKSWALRYAREHAADALALYHAESALRHAYQMLEGPDHDPLSDALRPYLREYAPDVLAGDPPVDEPESTGPRAEGAHLMEYGLELTDQGAYHAAEEALARAFELREQHDSPHAIAEAEVALARLNDLRGRYEPAAERLISAAERLYRLGAADSLSAVRRALARVYRHMDRLHDALDVLDDAPQAHFERALILRAQGNYTAAVEEMAHAPEATPYTRAEIFLLAGQHGEALAAIADQDDPASALLRAQVYHLQGAVDEAIRGYELALERWEAAPDDGDSRIRARTLRGLGAALASAGRYDAAREALESALTVQRAQDKADPARLGRTLRLLAAVFRAAGDDSQAIETARQAIEQLEKTSAPLDLADAYRTLGRALWRQAQYVDARDAFEREVEAAQSVTERDESRIGLALHHLADTYRETGALDRAIANYRRALTHLDAAAEPFAYLITQVALHRALMEASRLPAALDVSQEIVDHLARHPRPDLAQLGYAHILRARSQQAMERPIRASQSLADWTRVLTVRADEAAGEDRPALRVLILGLAVRSLLAEDRPALALDFAEQALRVAGEHYPDSLPAWAACRDLGEVYMALDRPEEAIITLEPLLADVVRQHDHPAGQATFAFAHQLTGQGYRTLGDMDAALKHLKIAFEHEPVDEIKGRIQETIGDIYLEIGQPTQAVESLRAALPLLPRDQYPDVVAHILTTLAHTLGGLNRYAEAIGVYEEALVVLRDVEGVSPVHTADVLRTLGQTHEAQGQLPEAARAYRRALNVLERVDAPRPSRDLLHLLARVTAAMGDPSAAQLYEQARDATAQWGDARELGEVLRELADVHRDGGRLMPAIQNYQAALDCQPAPPLIRERAQTLRSLGRAYAQMGRYDEARAAWTEALDLSAELPDQSPQEIALTHHAIAEAHRSQEHFDDAERSFREALAHHTPGTVQVAATWRALGQALHAAGRFDEAVEAFKKALEAEKAQPQQANARLVQTLQLLANAYEDCGDLDSAIARHHEALVYMDRDLQPVAYTDTLRVLGGLYAENGDYAQAHKAFNDALEIESRQSPRDDDRISTTLQSIADTYRAQGDLEKAAEFYQKVTVYANLARRASEDLRDTLNELERRRATLQAAQQSLALLDRSDETNLKDLAFVYALIAHSYAGLSQPQDSAETINTLLDTLETRTEALNPQDPDPDIRALAHLATARQAQNTDDLPAALAACQSARDTVRNANLRWVIGQLARALE